MFVEVPTVKKVNIKYIAIKVPVRYGEEDMPFDFPMRKGDEWIAKIDLDTNKIVNWPQGKSGSFSLKVVDEGIYALLDEDGAYVAQISYNYVPNRVIPGEYGDYINMKIDETGKVTNMPYPISFDDFFKKNEDD